MTTPGQYFPNGPLGPVITGNDWSVDRFLKTPTMITRQIQDLVANKTIASNIFRPISAPTGTVIYEEAVKTALFVDDDPNRQPGAVGANGEYPWVGVEGEAPKTVTANGYGGQFAVTDTERRRDSRDLLGSGTRKLANTLIDLSNKRAVAAFYANANVLTFNAGATWVNTSVASIQDVQKAVSMINNQRMGYKADTALLSPASALTLIGNKDLWAARPRENTGNSGIYSTDLDGIAGLRWIVDPNQHDQDVIILSSQLVGGIATEVPIHAEVVPEPLRSRTRVIGFGWDVPVITDPKAAVIIKQVAA